MLLAAIWLIPVVGLVVAIPVAQLIERVDLSEPLPATVTVGSRQEDLALAVVVKLEVAAPVEVKAPTSGTITAVRVEEGQEISQGLPLVDIDYHRIAAFVMSSPLVRDLALGDRGQDVAVLTRYLSQLGYLPADRVGSTFDWHVHLAVIAFERAFGRPGDGVFRVAYVAYLPESVNVVGSVKVEVGDTVSPATAVLAAPRQIVRAELIPTGTAASIQVFGGDPVALRAGSDVIPLSSASPSPEELGGLGRWLNDQFRAGALTVDDEALSNPTYSGAVLALREPRLVGTVPASAVYVTDGGTACVFPVSGDQFEVALLNRAKALDSAIGEVGIDEDQVGQTVVRDAGVVPREIRDQCG